MHNNGHRRFFIVAFLAFAAFIGVALAKQRSLDWPFLQETSFRDVQNLAGPFGSLLAWLCVKVLGGLFAWFVPISFLIIGVAMAVGQTRKLLKEVLKITLIVFLLNIFFSLISYTKDSDLLSGWVGRGVAGSLADIFGNVGTTILVTACLLIVLLSRLSFLGRLVLSGFRSEAVDWNLVISGAGGSVRIFRSVGHRAFALATALRKRVLDSKKRRALQVTPDAKNEIRPEIRTEQKSTFHSKAVGAKAAEIHAQKNAYGHKKRPTARGVESFSENTEETVSVTSARAGKSIEEASLPPLSLLDDAVENEVAYPQEELKAWAKVLEDKLANYNIKGKVTAINHGPLITIFEFEPSPGVKVKDIVSRADDITLAMKARSLRLIAPIPGRSVVGIEIPNPKGALVYLRNILMEIPERMRLSGIMVGIGVDVMGKPFYMNLCNAPHLLVAGTTGSGKSVCLHALLSSILFQYRPSDVRLLIVDPKMVEMNLYNGLPHLLHPVSSDPRETVRVFHYLINEMERRKELFKDNSVKNIESYNSKIAMASKAVEVSRRLPYIVLVVDELGDLIISKGADLEMLLSKLSNMARAVGIHMIVATQRPSVDVIVGKTKANFPTRIAFRVASRVDSRTILDTIGAEKLIGRGDMLYTDAKNIKPKRLHGALITEPEIERIVSHWKGYEYTASFLEPSSHPQGSAREDSEEDPLYEDSKSIVLQYRQGSTSLLQRKLHIGYARAARLLDQLEQNGIVGPPDSSKPREVLVPEESNHSIED